MMKKLKLLVLALVLLLILVMVFFSYIYKGNRSALQPTSTLSQEELIQRGAYLARAGDCIACHVAKDGQPFAGGLGIASPVGMIYTSNITPDKETGIGNYTLQDFDNALRYGVRQNGDSMYPAMPFPSFAKTSDEDVQALYAYFMHGVQPVSAASRGTDIVWPLSMRWPLAAWRMVFAPEAKPFTPAAGQDAMTARGAYLVQGLGHCGTCHTPRNGLTLAERAYSDQSPLYLSGSATPIDGWVAISLRGDHRDGLGSMTEEELFELLKTGRNSHSAVFGGMADVVNDSLQYLSDDDLRAIAHYLKTLPAANSNDQPFVYDDKTAQALFSGDVSQRGAQVFVDNCAACHRTTGKGYEQTFPALAGNPVVQGADPSSLINIVLKGATLEGTQGAPTSYTMPAFAWRLSDQEVADVLTFIRSSWGNQAAAVDAAEVGKYRSQLPSGSDKPVPLTP